MSNCNCRARLGLLGLLYCINYDSGNGMQTCGVPGTSHACAMITGTILDTSFGQDTSVGHLQFLTLHWLNRYQIRYMMLSTTT